MSKLIAMIENKAFVLSLLSTIAAATAVFGYNLPVTSILSVYGPLMAMLGVQGWTASAQTKMAMQHAHEVRMAALTNPTAAIRVKEGGFSRLSLMIGIVFMGLALAAALHLTHSDTNGASTVDTVEGVALGPTGCATTPPIVTDIVDCVKAEAIVVSDGYTVTQVVAAVWGAISGIVSGGIAAVIPVLENLAVQFGPDLVACIVDDYPASGSGAGSGSAAPVVASTRYGVTLDLDTKAKLLNAIRPGKTFNHGKKRK